MRIFAFNIQLCQSVIFLYSLIWKTVNDLTFSNLTSNIQRKNFLYLVYVFPTKHKEIENELPIPLL